MVLSFALIVSTATPVLLFLLFFLNKEAIAVTQHTHKREEKSGGRNQGVGR
jgi:hypothetical protein